MKKFIMFGLLLCLLSGCVTTSTQIAYTVYPVGYLIQRIGGSKYKTVSIQNDEVVQRASLKDNYIEILENSQILFDIGGIEPYRYVYNEEITKHAKGVKDLSLYNVIYLFQRYTPINNNGDLTYVEGPYYRGEAFDDIDINQKDLNLWIDPIIGLSMAKDILNWLVATYPEDTNVFMNNYSSLENDLVRLDAEYQALATKIANQEKEIKFVSMSASFGNWQKTYGVQVYPVVLSKFGALPTDEQLEIIKAKIVADKVKYIVYEPNMPSDMVDLFNQLQEELKLTRVELSSLSGLTQTQNDNGKDYISIMYENLQVLETMATSINQESE